MLNKKLGLIALLLSLVANELLAGSLTNYAVGDVLVCFRTAAGANDLVVDAGPIATLTNATVNQRIPISYTGSQLKLAAPTTNSVIWSAFTWLDDNASFPASIQWTLFVSRPRTAIWTQSRPWTAVSQNAQALAGGEMSLVSGGASVCLGYNAVNTPTAIIEPDDAGNSNPQYGAAGESYVGALISPDASTYNFGGFFGGNPEITAPANLTSSGKVIRSDFYQIPPSGGGSVKFLGYFEMNTNGMMTYVAYPAAPTVTTVAATSITTTNARLNSTVNPNSDAATLFFQYGLTTSYGSTSTTSLIGTNSGSYGLTVSNLLGGTTYHFRAAAYNRAGTNFGSDLTFTTLGGGALVTPVITAFSRNNGISYVSFTTGGSGTYTLRGTNNAGLGAARINWPAIASVGGNGFTNILQDTTSAASMFYTITAQ